MTPSAPAVMPGAGQSASAISEADWSAAVAAIRGLPSTATILLVCHVTPDGDALGSMLGFGLGLRQLGYAPLATFPAPFELVPPFDELLAAAREQDAEVERLAAGAEYAGDPQPYKLDEPAADEGPDPEADAGDER